MTKFTVHLTKPYRSRKIALNLKGGKGTEW